MAGTLGALSAAALTPHLPRSSAGIYLVAVGVALAVLLAPAAWATRVWVELRWAGRSVVAPVKAAGPGLVRGPRAFIGWSALEPAADRPGRSSPAQVLVRSGKLFVVLDLRPDPASRSATDGLVAALDPLTTMGGIRVGSIQWVFDAGAKPPRTLVVLSFDPVVNSAAIDARGCGAAGVSRMVTVTVARAVALLSPHGWRPRLLDATAAASALAAVGPFGARPAVSDGQAPGPQREHRREMLSAGRWHRAVRLEPSGTADLWATSAAPALARDLVATAHRWAGPRAGPVRTVITIWMRAGPNGASYGAGVHLSADRLADLDELERELQVAARRRHLSSRTAVAEQRPLLSSSPPLGGPQ